MHREFGLTARRLRDRGRFASRRQRILAEASDSKSPRYGSARAVSSRVSRRNAGPFRPNAFRRCRETSRIRHSRSRFPMWVPPCTGNSGRNHALAIAGGSPERLLHRQRMERRAACRAGGAPQVGLPRRLPLIEFRWFFVLRPRTPTRPVDSLTDRPCAPIVDDSSRASWPLAAAIPSNQRQRASSSDAPLRPTPDWTNRSQIRGCSTRSSGRAARVA